MILRANAMPLKNGDIVELASSHLEERPCSMVALAEQLSTPPMTHGASASLDDDLTRTAQRPKELGRALLGFLPRATPRLVGAAEAVPPTPPSGSDLKTQPLPILAPTLLRPFARVVSDVRQTEPTPPPTSLPPKTQSSLPPLILSANTELEPELFEPSIVKGTPPGWVGAAAIIGALGAILATRFLDPGPSLSATHATTIESADIVPAPEVDPGNHLITFDESDGVVIKATESAPATRKATKKPVVVKVPAKAAPRRVTPKSSHPAAPPKKLTVEQELAEAQLRAAER